MGEECKRFIRTKSSVLTLLPLSFIVWLEQKMGGPSRATQEAPPVMHHPPSSSPLTIQLSSLDPAGSTNTARRVVDVLGAVAQLMRPRGDRT
jgi:hypothetical protein